MKIIINDFCINFKLSTILIFLLMIALGYIGQFFILYMFVIFHEIIHILTLYCFGKKCRSIVIMPVGLCAEIDGIEDMRLYKRNIVIISAPLFNIIIGLLFNSTYFGLGNLLIGFFNLLPIYPLDGARLFQNITGYYLGTLRANKLLMITGNIFIVILFVCGIIQLVLFDFNFSIIIIAMYVYKERKKINLNRAYYFYKCLIKNKKRTMNKIKFVKTDMNISLKEILYKFGIDYYTVIYVNGKIIDEDRIKEFISKYGMGYKLMDILEH